MNLIIKEWNKEKEGTQMTTSEEDMDEEKSFRIDADTLCIDRSNKKREPSCKYLRCRVCASPLIAKNRKEMQGCGSSAVTNL